MFQAVESIIEKSKAEEMTEVPARPNEDSRAIVELLEAGPDSHFTVNVDRTGMVGNSCGIKVDPAAVKHCVDVGTETEPILESVMKHFVDVGTQTDPPRELIMVSENPVVQTIITPEEKRKKVAMDHTYSKTKLDCAPENVLTKPEPEISPLDDDPEMSDLSDEEWYDDVGDTGSVCSSNASDEEWLPDSEDEDSDDENKEYFEDPSSNWLEDNEQSSNESKSIVFDSCLKQLFQICRNCGDVVKKAYLKQRGSLICVTTVCIAGHTELWFSQPFTKGTATGNLICAGGILFTGNHFSRASALMSACNIRFFKKGNFNLIQRKYLWPVVNNGYLTQQKEILRSFRGHPLVLAGDGRCDSPGHNAKYGTYSLIEVTTEKIVDFSLVQVSEVANSNCMEKEGLKRCLDKLERDGQLIDMLATDR